jgi:hypothetical protein
MHSTIILYNKTVPGGRLPDADAHEDAAGHHGPAEAGLGAPAVGIGDPDGGLEEALVVEAAPVDLLAVLNRGLIPDHYLQDTYAKSLRAYTRDFLKPVSTDSCHDRAYGPGIPRLAEHTQSLLRLTLCVLTTSRIGGKNISR